MKKIYLKPDIKIVDIYPTRILENSGDEPEIPVYTESGDPVINDGKDVW